MVEQPHFDSSSSPGESVPQPAVLLVGDRRLYLEALGEYLAARAGATVRLALPRLREQRALPPDVQYVVIESPEPSLLTGLVAELADACPQAKLLVLDGSLSHGDKRATGAGAALEQIDPHRPLAALTMHLSPGTGSVVPGRPNARSASEDRNPLAMLTEREMSVLRLTVSGQSLEEIAETLEISRHTVRTHIQNSMAKMGARSRTQLITQAINAGLRTAQRDRPS